MSLRVLLSMKPPRQRLVTMWVFQWTSSLGWEVCWRFRPKGTEDVVVLLSLLLSCNTVPMLLSLILLNDVWLSSLLWLCHYYFLFHHILLLSFSARSYCFLILPTWRIAAFIGPVGIPPSAAVSAIGRDLKSDSSTPDGFNKQLYCWCKRILRWWISQYTTWYYKTSLTLF